ncbi:hypothetical protein YC2023_059649 [Brassica napus]
MLCFDRLREIHTFKGHVESVAKLKGMDIDTSGHHYTLPGRSPGKMSSIYNDQIRDGLGSRVYQPVSGMILMLARNLVQGAIDTIAMDPIQLPCVIKNGNITNKARNYR